MAVEFGEGLAPNYSIRIAGHEIGAGITRYIEKIEYESCEAAIDRLSLSVLNPEFKMSELKLFLPGNEIELWLGYGPLTDEDFIGRAEITKVRGNYPQDGIPSMDVIALTKDHRMTEVMPDPEEPEQTRPKKKAVWNGMSVKDVVTIMSSPYQFQPDVDETPSVDGNFYHPRGMSDYDFIRSLANLTGFYFWVDCDSAGRWHLRFKNPETMQREIQARIYTFAYNEGDGTTLLSFEPEMLFKGTYTKVVAELRLPSGKVISKSFVEEREHGWGTKPSSPAEEIEGELEGAGSIKVFLGDFGIEVPDTFGIRDEATLEWWVNNWIKKHRQEFVRARGMVIGLESLRARQIHRIRNVGTQYDGSWYFSRVRHVLDSGSGYVCEFDARKVVSL